MSSRKLILVVDDEQSIRELASRVLSRAGHEVVCAGNGVEASLLMEARPADLAVVDLVMPLKDGIETIAEFRQRWPGCKIIAVSGGHRADVGKQFDLARVDTADEKMSKPFRFAEMVRVVDRLCQAS